MALDPTTLANVIRELQPLVGGRIQKVDLVAERELVLDLRYPSRTIRVLLSARPGAGRVHVIAERPPREVPGGDVQRALRRRLEGRPLVALTADRHTVEVDARDAVVSIRIDGGRDAIRFLPPSGREVPVMPDGASLPERFPISESLAERHGTSAPAAAADVLRARIGKTARAKKQKLDKLRANLGKDRDKLTAMMESRALGELLKPLIGRLPRGAKEARATDWATGEERVIPLDPALGPKGNMERFFTRAKKAERGLPVVAERLAKVERELAALDATLAEIAAADLTRLLELAEAGGGPKVRIEGLEPGAEKSGGSEKKSPLDRWSRRFVALDGTEIRVGKGAKENDRLTFSAAKGDDVWLHASGASGAHVLLRLSKGQAPSPEALVDAAHLAAHYSGYQNSAKVEVMYTEARWVKKHKGDPPGRVSVSKAKTLLVAIDPARLDRLFGRGV
ncbi:NFACT RNA binding domain-containing protein [Myxococcota bacterium]|nr:NFACT RNA binding domain-containing protein [Myxococcota bacterium]